MAIELTTASPQVLASIRDVLDVPTISGAQVFSGTVYAENLIYISGNQTISGIKTFDTRPLVNGTGVLLSGESVQLDLTSVVKTTGDQTVSGIKTFINSINISGLSIDNNLLFYSQPSGFFSGAGIIGTGDGGVFLGRNKISQNTLLFKEENIGNSFSAKLTDSTKNWRGIAISSDGKYQTAVINNGYIYISNDYGNTWRQKGISTYWTNIAMSSCGKYQTAITNNIGQSSIYISNDYGNTWVFVQDGISYYGIKLSSDGKYQIIAVYSSPNGLISKDYGVTWSSIGAPAQGVSSAISSDGKYITLGGADSSNRICVSSNYGATWNLVGPISTPPSIVYSFVFDMSSDGKYQVAAVTYGGANSYIYISNNYGNTWIQKTSSGSRAWNSVSMSSDGKYIVASVSSENIYISSNYGETWKSIATSKAWTSVKINSNGKYIVAVVDADYIYISKTDELIDGDLYANNLVYNTGNQTISGIKTFSEQVYLKSIVGVSGNDINIFHNYPIDIEGNVGASISINGGSGSFAGGNARLYAGYGSTIGGNLDLRAGNSSAVPGDVSLYAGRHTSAKGEIKLDGDVLVNPFFGNPGDPQLGSRIRIYKTGIYGLPNDILTINQSTAIMELKNGLIVSGLISGDSLTGVFNRIIANNAVDLNNIDNLNLSGIDINIQGATVDLGNSKLINTIPDIINLNSNFNITGAQNNRIILVNSSNQITGTIVSGNTGGFNASIIQIGNGQVQITGIGNGVTINSFNNQFKTAGKFAAISLLHTGNNGYLMYGNTAT